MRRIFAATLECELAAMTKERATYRSAYDKACEERGVVTAKYRKLERELAAMTAAKELAERQVAVLTDFVQAFLDTVDEPPRPNCSCCISPPCADCVDNSGLRRLFVQAKKILAEAGKEGGKG